MLLSLFFFNDTATTEIYTLSLHDALPILPSLLPVLAFSTLSSASDIVVNPRCPSKSILISPRDRKSTRLNSSHGYISYAVFCLKKKNTRRRLLLALFVESNDIGYLSTLAS